jgi:hypothetical protein
LYKQRGIKEIIATAEEWPPQEKGKSLMNLKKSKNIQRKFS